jgi:hypothetical protein
MRRIALVILIAIGACHDRNSDVLQQAVETACACKTHLEELAAKNELTAVARVEAKACADDALRQVPSREGASSQREQKLAREMRDCVASVYNFDTPSAPESSEPASARTP